ncbi:hypothetical protein F2Q70_00018357 [Brassica cretica]|uniref:Uncharacterized protein n=1 Tax=Brassica cretica TaxID=69181 RepID=A0A8S9HWN4_BRACR|nr:hypothetical protein F2Q70_00018357 [Brassica cretica]
MLVLLMDCSCTDFGQLMHHVSTHISTLAFLVNSSCTDLDMSSSFDELIDAISSSNELMAKRTEGMDYIKPAAMIPVNTTVIKTLLGFNAPVRMLLAETCAHAGCISLANLKY